MGTEALFVYCIISISLLLAICTILFCLFRKYRTKEKKLSKELDLVIDKSSRKTELFSNMAHELKTPLSVILGALQVMEIYMGTLETKDSLELNDKVARNIKVVKCNCFRLLRLIYNMLDLTRAEAGCQLLKPKNCDLDILLEEIVNSVRPYAEEKQLTLQYNHSSERIVIAVDVEKIERVMLNLLSNAFKFTKPGGFVHVSPYRVGNRACISVRDSGIGIPVEKQEGIFSRYCQIGHLPRAENEGSGIGLSLVKSFVDLHEGNIKIESEYGKGAEFIIDLPIKLISSDTNDFMEDELNSGITEAEKLEFSIFPTFSA